MKTPIHRSLLASALALLSMLLAPSVQAQTLNDLYPEIATVLAADGAAFDEFGSSISLSGDTLAVGVREHLPRERAGVCPQRHVVERAGDVDCL
jgi:FG-GAP repeat